MIMYGLFSELAVATQFLSLKRLDKIESFKQEVDSDLQSRRLDSKEIASIKLNLTSQPLPRVGNQTDLDEAEKQSILTGIGSRASTRNQQYPVNLPETGNEEYGWVLFNETFTGRWRRPKITNEIVRYSETYFEQNGVNPFQRFRA